MNQYDLIREKLFLSHIDLVIKMRRPIIKCYKLVKMRIQKQKLKRLKLKAIKTTLQRKTLWHV